MGDRNTITDTICKFIYIYMSMGVCQKLFVTICNAPIAFKISKLHSKPEYLTVDGVISTSYNLIIWIWARIFFKNKMIFWMLGIFHHLSWREWGLERPKVKSICWASSTSSSSYQILPQRLKYCYIKLGISPRRGLGPIFQCALIVSAHTHLVPKISWDPGAQTTH